MTLDDLINTIRTLPANAPLVFSTADGPIGEGYHVTELKLANINSIDCGAQTDTWTETTLQLLDGQGRTHMPVGKFTSILEQSARKIVGLGDSPLRVEFSHGNAGLQIFEPVAPEFVDGGVLLKLQTIHAQCKPALTGKQTGETASCCASLPPLSAHEDLSEDQVPEPGCCGGPAPKGVDACCVKDADAKAAGESGCGCNSKVTESPAAKSQSSSDFCCD